MPKYNSVKLLPATLVYVPLSALQLVYTCIPNVEECLHSHANVNKDNETSTKALIFAHLVIMCRRMSKLQLEYTCIYTYNLIQTSINMKQDVDCRYNQHVTIFRNPQKPDWVAKDCCMLSLLLVVPSCIYSFWHGVIPTYMYYFIFYDFYTCFTDLALTVAYGEMILPVPACMQTIVSENSVQVPQYSQTTTCESEDPQTRNEEEERHL